MAPSENPNRAEIEQLIEHGDLEGLLKKTGELHGHYCPYLGYGVKAGYIAMQELGIKSKGMKEVIAIVETNNCFSDGIQMITGCTFGNNALIYKDYGKNAVTGLNREEKVMETRARIKDGEPVCIQCAGDEYYIMDGKGITTAKDAKLE
ncbi:MAG: FmdE family protein [Methanosarcinales archaeon]